MKSSGRKNLEIKDFSGGLVTKSPPKNIDTKFTIDSQNVYNEGAMLRKRLGITVLNPTTATGEGNGIYNWFRTSTDQWLLVTFGSVLSKIDVTGATWDGTLDTLTAHSASGTAFSVSTVYFANYNGVLLLSTDSRDVIQKMTVTDTSYFNLIVGGTGTAPRAKYVLNWKNHAWFLNCMSSEDRIVHSSVNSYNNFTGDTYGSNDIITENDIGLTGGFILNGRLYATKAFSVHRFTYTGSPSPLVEIRAIKSTTGTRSPRSIKNVNTPDGEVVMMLGANRKLYICDGQDMDEVSDGIDVTNSAATVYMQNINADALNDCYAVVHEDLNWYELFVCIGTATAPSHSIVYDYRQKAFWPMTNRNFKNAVISDDGSGRRRVYAQGNTNGKIYTVHSSNADDGSNIDAFWTSEKLGPSILLSVIDEVELEMDAVACTPTFSWRADYETTWVTNTLKASTYSHNFALNRKDNMIQFKMQDNSTNPTFKWWTLIASERIVGGGK